MSRWRAAARRWLVLGILLAPALANPAFAQSPAPSTEPEIPAAVGFVNDRAGVIDEGTRAKLEAFLDQVQRKTGAQFAVLTVATTAPLTPTEYKVRVFQKWGIGHGAEDDGLLLLLAIAEREAWFETGYGLEGVLPDGLEARIVRERMAPRFRTGDYAGGVVEGVLAAAARIAGEKGVTLEWDGRELRYDSAPRGRRSPLLALVIFVVVMIVLSRIGGGPGGWQRRRRGFGRGIYWGGMGGMGGWGGSGGWGGGFGGGGGGGSFGGFGGGSSGGGGGGGRW